MAIVRYLVDDVDTAVSFYVDALGFELDRRMGPAFSIIRRGDLVLWVAGPGASAALPMPNGDQPVPGGWNRFVLKVEDLDAEVERLRAAGVRFRNEPVSGPGGRQVLVEDPSGNPIELFQAA
jgi:catechol 2,3-dioxygenase-like lactoylglutathione lyase family enzyme